MSKEADNDKQTEWLDDEIDLDSAVMRHTQRVKLDSGKTITEYLSLKGLEPGVELEGSPAEEQKAGDILRVGGGRRYEIGSNLGEGGMGVVSVARDLNCRRYVAMKLLPPKQQDNEEDLLRFIEEAQITSQLEHPNIVPVHELGIDSNGNVYYTMKLVQGKTLTEILLGIRRGNQEVIDQYPLERLLTIFQKVCDAVAFSHSKNVVHRDLKPDNVMIGGFGEVLIMDWGLAKVYHCQGDEEQTIDGLLEQETRCMEMPTPRQEADDFPETTYTDIDSVRSDDIGSGLRTMSGRIMGTPGFMAPEQADPEEEYIDFRADIYSLGAILYSVLTLRPPVTGKNVIEIIRKSREGNIFAPTDFNPRPGGQAPKAVTLHKSKPVRFMHCPGGQIPTALSDIVMKALATDPAERYASVKDFQRSVEAYQHGMIWHLVIDEDFSSFSNDVWEIVGGQHEIVNGELRLHGGEPQFMCLKKDLPGDVRIEFECRQESVYLNTVGCFISGIHTKKKKEIPASGYEFKFGGYDNSVNLLMRSDRKVWSEAASPLVRGKTYQVVAERIGGRLRMVVNGIEIFSWVDVDPLSGSDRTAVGVLGWLADTRYSRIRVYAMGTPWKSDILDTAERQLQKGHYVTAMDLFQEVMDSFPDADRQVRAKRGFETARNREQMMRSIALWSTRLTREWPEVDVQVRMDNDGLTVDITNARITDLSPLEGMPITSLYCGGNCIEDLSPLQGMPLMTLNCSGNPVKSLEPLRGARLDTLICECCEIESLAPLQGMPLSLLNCGGNPLKDGLEPLRGMRRLNWLGCWGTGISTLEPIQKLPLSSLYCDANEVESLDPLKEMMLNTLNCGGNRISDLEPLRGAPLSSLHCACNRITDLDPLREMPLNMFSCHGNQIKSLQPLEGMHLGALMCGNNPLASLEPFVDNPPENFIFDSDALTSQDLESLRQEWERSERTQHLAFHIEILLALRSGDLAVIKKLAVQRGRKRYLFVPRFMRWEEAKAYCERLGGCLLTIDDREENDFIASLMPGGSWFWMGLVNEEDGQRWIDGTPFTFDLFEDFLRERMPGPKIFFNGTWTADVYTNAQNCFMIQWVEEE